MLPGAFVERKTVGFKNKNADCEDGIIKKDGVVDAVEWMFHGIFALNNGVAAAGNRVNSGEKRLDLMKNSFKKQSRNLRNRVRFPMKTAIFFMPFLRCCSLKKENC